MAGRWLDEVEGLAERALPPPVFRYVSEGAREEISLGEAVEAWRSVRVLPHVLRDVSVVDTTATLLGTTYEVPMGIAPMTLQRAADPGGEVTMARAAAAAGVPLVLSSNAGSTFADVGATGAHWWLQVYVSTDREETADVLRAAAAAGAGAVVLTADTPVLGTRVPRDGGPRVWDVVDPAWVGANAPTVGVQPADRHKAMDLGPSDVAWLAEVSGLPVVVRGVLRAHDARRCVEAGAAAVWVSNHGGRQLDQVAATAYCLPRVRDAVGDTVEVYVDGGVRTGLHVLLAASLGADAAFLGRPAFHALAAGGGEGVTRALGELRTELVEAMRLSGCPTLPSATGIACPSGGFSPRSASDQREQSL